MSGGPKETHVRAHLGAQDRLPMWVVCRPTTTDFAGHWTARMHYSLPAPEATNLLAVADSLEGVRDQLPPGLTNIGRQAGDDPVIEEVWL